MKATFTAMRFSGGAGVRHMGIRHALVLLLLLVLPIAKDGPLNLELVEWKFLLVLMLLLASLPEVGHIVRSDKYKQALVLATFSMVLTIVAYLLSDVQELSRELSLAMVANTLFLVALCRLFNADLLRTGITCIAIGSLVICTVAILQYVVIRFHLSHPALVALLPPEQQMGYFDLDLAVGSEGIRVSAVFFHSNQLGHYLAVAFALFFPLFLQAENRKNKVFYGMVIVAVTTCSLLSQSRGGLILIGFAVTMTVAMYGVAALKRWKNMLLIALGVVVMGAGFFAINATAFLARIASPSLSSREVNWLYTLGLVPDNALAGLGRGASGYHLTVNYPAIEYQSLLNNFDVRQAVNYWANNPHNYYLATIVESGMFALAAEVLLFWLMIKTGLRVFAYTQRSLIGALAVSAITILIMEFVRGLFEAYVFLGAPETGGIIAFVCAMILYVDSRMQRRTFEPSKQVPKNIN